MSFEKMVRIPLDRVGSLIGRSGSTKSLIEQACSVRLDIDSDSGEIYISGKGGMQKTEPFKAVEIVTAIGRGFAPDTALSLLDEENTLHVMDLREFAGKSPAQIERIKGRIIGEGGRARSNMERLSDTKISVYGRTVSIIGSAPKLRLAVDAISSLSHGSMHGSVYNRLEGARRRAKIARLNIWEDQNVIE